VGGNHFSFLFYAAANRKYSKINLYFALDFSYCAAKVNVKQTGRLANPKESLTGRLESYSRIRPIFPQRDGHIRIYRSSCLYIIEINLFYVAFHVEGRSLIFTSVDVANSSTLPHRGVSVLYSLHSGSSMGFGQHLIIYLVVK